MEWLKIGEVGAIDKAKGMVSVTFGDEDDVATGMLPYLTFGGEYKMPKTGEAVLVAKIANVNGNYVVLGGFWNESNKPPITAGSLYKKMLSEKSYLLIDSADRMEIYAPDVSIRCSDGTFSVNDYLRRKQDG